MESSRIAIYLADYAERDVLTGRRPKLITRPPMAPVILMEKLLASERVLAAISRILFTQESR